MLESGFLDRLAAAGVTPEQIDLVVLTHVHVDHVVSHLPGRGLRTSC